MKSDNEIICQFCGAAKPIEKKGLTTKQHQLKIEIEKYVTKPGHSPTQSALADNFQKSVSNINAMLQELETKGHIKRAYWQKQSLQLID